MEMKKSFLRLRSVVRFFTHRMTTVWEEPFDGQPAVFCPNHAGLYGPVDMMAHFELCDIARPWFNAAVADPKQIPAYVRQDYWWKPGCALEPLYNATLPYLAAALMPPVMRTVPGIPVYHDMQVLKTFRQSLKCIQEGEHLVIFPQQPSGYKSHHMTLNKGFLQIAVMAQRSAKVALKFYPVHIDHRHHTITVKKPIAYDLTRTLAQQEQEILDHLAAGL